MDDNNNDNNSMDEGGISLERIEEYRLFKKVLNSFNFYSMQQLTGIKKRQEDCDELTSNNPSQLSFLKPKIYSKLNQATICLKVNQQFLKFISDQSQFIFFPPEEIEDLELALQKMSPPMPSQLDMDKVSTTLKQLTRDWSEEGKVERDAAYLPICDSLLKEFESVPFDERYNIRVLVPGAGLGRLVYDIAKLGFSSEGNEFSYPMLITSFFILNNCQEPKQFKIYPYALNFSNHWSTQHQFLPVEIPDVIPGNLNPNINFSMSAGDFTEAYGLNSDHKESWNCITTCFFIDTAKNICEYIDILFNCLKPNGVWINLGPLLYHFENNEDEPSIELTYEELKEYILSKGFIIEEEDYITCCYTANMNSMLQYHYNCIKFVARKPKVLNE